MKEVEIKAIIEDPQRAHQNIAEHTGQEWEGPITQTDVIFLPKGVSFVDIPDNTPVLRIRYLADSALFTFKKTNLQNPLERIEHEVAVEDGKKMENIIQGLGYEKTVTVKKTRQKMHYQNYELVLDDVSDLGHFIEVETFTDTDEEAEAARNSMVELLNTFEIGAYELTTIPYDAMIFHKENSSTQ